MNTVFDMYIETHVHCSPAFIVHFFLSQKIALVNNM